MSRTKWWVSQFFLVRVQIRYLPVVCSSLLESSCTTKSSGTCLMVPPVPGVVVAYTVMPVFCSMLGGVGGMVIGVLVGVDA